MRTYDFTPLYRSAIGFDRLAHLFDQAQPSYPPYNVELVNEDQYRITMAIAGFERDELNIDTERDTLQIIGRRQKEDGKRSFLHRDIAARDFEHRFQLANGLLNIDLVREVPEALKPRKIAIEDAGLKGQRLEERQAA